MVAAIAKEGRLRDRTLITLMLHTGLRAREVCRLKMSVLLLVIYLKQGRYKTIPVPRRT